MRPREHYSEAKRIASDAEAKQREPNQPFNPEPWLKAQTHALLAVYGQLEALRSRLAPEDPVRRAMQLEPIPGEAE